MMRAFRTERNFTKGIDNGIYLQLYNIESGLSLTPRHYSKQFEKVRAYLLRATAKMLKWKLTEQERLLIARFTGQIENAAFEETLYNAINGLLDATQRFNQ